MLQLLDGSDTGTAVRVSVVRVTPLIRHVNTYAYTYVIDAAEVNLCHWNLGAVEVSM